MKHTKKPDGWKTSAWILYQCGVLRAAVVVMLPVYLVVGIWSIGIKDTFKEWYADIKEATNGP